MIYVFGVLAVGLAVAAFGARDRSTRIWLALCCALNLAGVAKALITNDPYAFKLRPNPGYDWDPPYRR